jgi:hypothetical protein
MKQNMNLTELVNELQIENAQKSDYVMPYSKLVMGETGIIVAEGTKGLVYTPNTVFHNHLGTKLTIPATYYRRMQTDEPALLANNVNTWLKKSTDSKGVMLRTFEKNGGNVARGLLSDRYGILDNYDVLFAVLAAIKASGVRVEIKECNVTDIRMYVNIVAPEVEVQGTQALRNYLKNGDRSHVGDGVISGLTITNSEVGFGSFEIRPRAVVLRCNNGMIVKDDRFRRVHLGAKLDSGEISWSDSTKQKNYELIISQTKDAINQFLSEGYLTSVVQKIEAASNQRLERPVDTVQNVCKMVATKLSLDDAQRNDIMNHFLEGGDLAASGVFQALTMQAQAMNADDRYGLESLAWDILPQIKSFDQPFVIGKN